MHTLFVFITSIGLLYLAILIIFSNSEEKKRRLKRILNPKNLVDRFHSEKMQVALKEIGFNIQSKYMNLFRYGTATVFLLTVFLSNLLHSKSTSIFIFLIAVIWILATSPQPYSPAGWILKKIKQNIEIKKDGELISLLRLYENNHYLKNNQIEFSAFCVNVAPYFQYIRNELLMASEIAIEDGIETALDWLVKQYRENHPFISDVRTIILTTESMNHEEAIVYLSKQGEVIAKISSEQHQKRWKFIGDIATIFNTLPSALIMLMIVALIIVYINLIRGNLNLQF